MKIGIDLGGSHIAIAVVKEDGTLIDIRDTILTEENPIAKQEIIEKYIIENAKDLMGKHQITEIGIAIPGTVNKTTIVKSVNLGIENYNIVEAIQREIPLRIKINNDAKCAALAENTYGCLKNYNRTLFLTLGTGIGTAVIINDQLLDTGTLPGCEAGHMVIHKDGLQCNCGRKGCFEKYGSMKAFKENLRKVLNFEEYQTGKMLAEILKRNEANELSVELSQKIDKVQEEYIEDLSTGIANLINIFEPEAIGIGGSFVYFADVLLPKLKAKLLEKNTLFNTRTEIIIVPAELGNDAGIIGSSLI